MQFWSFAVHVGILVRAAGSQCQLGQVHCQDDSDGSYATHIDMLCKLSKGIVMPISLGGWEAQAEGPPGPWSSSACKGLRRSLVSE